MKMNFVLVRYEQMMDELGDGRTRHLLAVSETEQTLRDYCLKEYGIPAVPIAALGVPVDSKKYVKDNFYYAVEVTILKIL